MAIIRSMGLKTTLIVVCLCLLTSCWDRTEINDLALVMATGLDLTEDGEIEATLQIALPPGITNVLPQGGGKANKPFLVVSEKGKDATDISMRLQGKLSRKIFLGHRRVVIFGEKLARHGIDRILDEFLRSHLVPLNSYVLTAHGSTAKKILGTRYALEQLPASGIQKIQANYFSLSTKIDEYLNDMARSGISPVTGAIKLEKNKPDQPFKIDEAAVYRDNQLVGFLPENEVRLLRWWKGREDKKGIKITIQAKPKDNKSSGTIGFELINSSSKIKLNITNEMPEATFIFKGNAKIVENNTRLDVTKNLNDLEQTLNDEIHAMARTMIDHAQKKLKADIFGLGEKIRKTHPVLWKRVSNQWGAMYPDIPINIKVEVKIERMGGTQAPAHLRKDEIIPVP